jgi:hypothetical protein
MEKHEFAQESNYLQSYLLARKQFKKIINNFNSEEFKSNFDELFYDDKNFKLFLKNQNDIVCGALGYIHEKRVFMDIFFWNYDLGDYNMHTVRIFFEKFFLKTKEMGLIEAILPLDENRKKFPSFKKHNQIFFRSTEEFKTNDPFIKDQYSHQYLLKVNYEHYFNQSK